MAAFVKITLGSFGDCRQHFCQPTLAVKLSLEIFYKNTFFTVLEILDKPRRGFT
jgi:hypothetical protein